MRPASKPGFMLVARRECYWLFHDRVALLLIFGVPLFAFVVLTTVFSHPVIRGLGVTVVDEDRSDASRALTEYISASPSLKIVDRSGTLSTAAQDIRSGKAISAVYIPPDFERDLKAQRRPEVVGFYNQQFLTAAGIASSGLSDALSAAVSAAAPAKRAAPTPASIGTLAGETIALVNPQKNYAQFLLRALLPMIIHVVITLAAGYSVGSEFRRRDAGEWLASAGGDPIVALVGKLAPLFGIFFLIMLAEPFVLEGVLKIPFRGDLPLMVAAGSLLIVAHLSMGALLQLLAGDLASGLGLAGLIVSPAFGYAGVGFPTVGMNAFAQGWSAILPLRWYMAVLLGQAAKGLPVSESAVPFAALAGLAVLYTGLALLRMTSLKRRGRFELAAPPEQPEIGGASRGIGGAFKAEWRRVLGMRSAFSLLCLAPLIYGVYYPQPYLNQILRKLPIAVVDSDLSDLSRRIVETLDASGALSVTVRARTLAEARTAIDRGKAFAAVEIPADTERDVLKGITAHIPIYADATYLFLYRSTASGVATAIGALTSARLARRPLGRKPRQGTTGELEPGGRPPAADLQPGGRLCELHRPGGVYADPATNASDRCGDADRYGAGKGRRNVCRRVRPRHRPSDHLPSGARALPHCAAALLRFFDTGTSSATLRPRHGFFACDQLHGAGDRGLVHAARKRDPPAACNQPASVLHRRLCVAARGDPRAGHRTGSDVPRRLCD
jgi:ABC-2 type transport system permease protein